jgi:hypothetical protein
VQVPLDKSSDSFIIRTSVLLNDKTQESGFRCLNPHPVADVVVSLGIPTAFVTVSIPGGFPEN